MNELDASLNRRLAELILRWEESVASGLRLSLAEFCADCPDMAVPLEHELSRLKSLDRFMFPERSAATITMSAEDHPKIVHPDFPSVPGYELLAEIGRGGMGIVYKARQESLGRIVAIKTLHGSHWGNSAYVARLRWEAKGLSRLAHPKVVHVIDIVETPIAVSIILEYVEGENLAKRLQRQPLPLKEAARLATELAHTLAFVHQRGLLHRDIKPANVLIDVGGNIRVADFGLVKEEASFGALTETGEHSVGAVGELGIGVHGLTEIGEYFGTPNYMAPEQTPGSHTAVDVRSDVYGIGATLYEMLSGHPPFAGGSNADTYRQVQSITPVPLRLSKPEIPRDLETICHKCLEKDPEQRFRNAQELADELERFQRGVPIHSRRIGSLERYWRWCLRRPALASLTGTSLAASVAVMGLLFLNNRNLVGYNHELKRLNDVLRFSVSELARAATNAKELQRIAEQHERNAKDALYAADINRAAIAMVQGDTREMTTLLEKQIPKQGATDRRGFEWWHLFRRAKRARRMLQDVGRAQYILCYTPERDRLAVAGIDSVVRIFDPETGKLDQLIPTAQIEVNGLAFSPDGKEMATAGDDGTIILWDRETGTSRLKFEAHPGKAFQIVYLGDGLQIACCGDDPVIRVFDTDTGLPAYTLEGHLKSVQSLFLADDAKTLVSTADDRRVRIWNLENRKEVCSFSSSGNIGPLGFDRKRGLLIVGDAVGELRTIDTHKRREIGSIKHFDRVSALALHPNGDIFAAGDASGQIRLRGLSPTGEIIETPYQPWHAHQGVVYSLVWSTDGSRLISTGDDGRVVSWNLDEALSAEPKELKLSLSDRFRLLPKSTTLLAKSSPNVVIRWDWSSATPLAKVSVHSDDHMSISPDGRFFAAVLPRGLNEKFDKLDEVQIYEVPIDSQWKWDKQLFAEWKPKAGELANIRFSPDSKSIAVSKWYQKAAGDVVDHTVWLVDIPKAERAQRIPVLFAKDSRFSPDGKQLALMTRTDLVLWNIAKEEAVWQIPNTFMMKIAFSPDGSRIATCGNDRLVRVINVSDRSIQFQSTNHRAPVRNMVFSPDGRLLATASGDGTIKLWHVPSGQELLEFSHPDAEVPHLEFSDDGLRLICQLCGRGAKEYSDRILIYDGSPFEP